MKEIKKSDLFFLVFKITPITSLIKIFFALVNALLPTYSVIIITKCVNDATKIMSSEDPKLIFLDLALLLVIFLIEYVIQVINGLVEKKHSLNLDYKLREEIIKYKSKILFEYFENKENYMLIEKVSNEFLSNTNNIFNNIISTLGFIIQFVSLCVLFVSNSIWQVGLILAISTIIISFISYKNSIYQYNAYKKFFSGNVELFHSTYILKDRSTADERTLFQYSHGINKKWKRNQENINKQELDAHKKILTFRNVTNIINLIICFIIIAISLILLINNRMTNGFFVAMVVNILPLVQGTSKYFIGLVSNFASQNEYMKDLNLVMAYKTDESINLEPTEEDVEFNSLEFKHVSFKYPSSDRYVLKNVSFKIEKDKSYAFVGHNGSGKTTIIKLITKLYTNYDGEIFINDVNIKDISSDKIKKIFGSIFQDFSKYNLTLKENIIIGDIKNILNKKLDLNNYKFLEIDKIIKKLPKGENTNLGKIEVDGQDLSGGEWQKLAIARMLNGNHNVYILDEPTASLDPIVESEIYTMFSHILKEKTVILISHRLGSVKSSDVIFVLADGQIIESGTHNELLHKKGTYYKMFESQKEWYKR